jgi:hypothetical protein
MKEATHPQVYERARPRRQPFELVMADIQCVQRRHHGQLKTYINEREKSILRKCTNHIREDGKAVVLQVEVPQT